MKSSCEMTRKEVKAAIRRVRHELLNMSARYFKISDIIFIIKARPSLFDPLTGWEVLTELRMIRVTALRRKRITTRSRKK